MNIKKYLREQAEKDSESLITESDRLFSKQLAEKAVESARQEEAEKRNRENKRKNKKH